MPEARAVAAAHQGGGVRRPRPLREADGMTRRTGDRPTLGVTMGDPAGVGPEIIARALLEREVQRTSRPVVIGDAEVMRAAAALLPSRQRVRAVASVEECRWEGGDIECLDLANVDAASLPR